MNETLPHGSDTSPAASRLRRGVEPAAATIAAAARHAERLTRVARIAAVAAAAAVIVAALSAFGPAPSGAPAARPFPPAPAPDGAEVHATRPSMRRSTSNRLPRPAAPRPDDAAAGPAPPAAPRRLPGGGRPPPGAREEVEWPPDPRLDAPVAAPPEDVLDARYRELIAEAERLARTLDDEAGRLARDVGYPLESEPRWEPASRVAAHVDHGRNALREVERAARRLASVPRTPEEAADLLARFERFRRQEQEARARAQAAFEARMAEVLAGSRSEEEQMERVRAWLSGDDRPAPAGTVVAPAAEPRPRSPASPPSSLDPRYRAFEAKAAALTRDLDAAIAIELDRLRPRLPEALRDEPLPLPDEPAVWDRQEGWWAVRKSPECAAGWLAGYTGLADFNSRAPITAVRAVADAQERFRAEDRDGDGVADYGTLEDLARAGLIDERLAAGRSPNYRLTVELAADGRTCRVIARPIIPERRSYTLVYLGGDGTVMETLPRPPNGDR